jgi:hypothetical protein
LLLSESRTEAISEAIVAGSLPFVDFVVAKVLVVIVEVVESGTMSDGDGSRVVSIPLYVLVAAGAGDGGEVEPKSCVNIAGVGTTGDTIGAGDLVSTTGGIGDAGGFGDGDAEGDAEGVGGKICRSGFKR